MIKDLEPETKTTIYDWTQLWNKLKATKGVRCMTRRSSTRRNVFIKYMIERLPTLEELNRRRPDIYTTTECQLCQDKVKETQAHLASCKGQKSLWKRIQKVTIATAWKGLKEEEKIRIPPYVLYITLFGEGEANEIEMREALIKGLIPKKTLDRLSQLLNTKSRQQFINVVVRTAWDTFYEQVWRIRCEKIIEWEKEREVTSKTKKKINKKERPKQEKKGKSARSQRKEGKDKRKRETN